MAKDTLLEALKAFPGTVLLVSHDRFILNELVNEVVEVGRGHAIRYLGNYDDYLRKKAEVDAAAFDAASKTSVPKAMEPARNGRVESEKSPADREARRLRERNDRRRQQIESDIEAKEAERAALAGAMSDADFYLKRKDADELIGRYEQLGREIERLYSELVKYEDQSSAPRSQFRPLMPPCCLGAEIRLPLGSVS